jgi:hypothetical protein
VKPKLVDLVTSPNLEQAKGEGIWKYENIKYVYNIKQNKCLLLYQKITQT